MAAKLAQGAGDFASITWAPAGVPGVGDTADSNGYAVTITSNVTCDALVGTNASAGGFTCSTAGVVITAAITATVRTVLTVSNSSGTVTVTGAVTGGSSASMRGVYKTSAGVLAITGDVTGGGISSGDGVRQDGSGPITVTGNVNGATGIGIYLNTSGSLTVSGTVTGGSAAGAYGVSNTSTGTVTVNTAVVGGSVAVGIYNSSSGIVTVNGTITGSANAAGVGMSGSGALIATGTITGGSAGFVAGVYNWGYGAIHAQGDTVRGVGGGNWAVQCDLAVLVTVRGTKGAGSVYNPGTTYSTVNYWNAGAPGNWSTAASWSLGHVPTGTEAADSNGQTVTIDADLTCAALFGSAPAAGGFSCSTARTITADVRATVRTVLTVSTTTGNTVTVAGPTTITGGCSGTSYGISKTGTCALAITGSVVGGYTGNGINCAVAGAITVSVNVTGAIYYGINNTSTGTVTVSGNATGGSGTSSYGINNSGAGEVTVSGQSVGGTGTTAYGVYNNSGTVTITTAVGNAFGPGGLAASAAGVYGREIAGTITRVYRAISGPYGQAACAGAVTMVSDTRNYSTWQKSDSTGLRALVGPTWPVQPWYQAPSGATAVAAYDSVGATDLADSYVNEANPGTYNAAPGVAPTWTDDVGWTFAAASSQYLTTGITPGASGWSIIVRVLAWTGTASGSSLFGTYTDNNQRWNMVAVSTGTHLYYRAQGSLDTLELPGAGVYAMAGQTAYKSAVSQGSIPTATNLGTLPLYIGAVNASGPTAYLTGTIAAVAIYSATLTQNDMEIVVVEMARLPRAVVGGSLGIFRRVAAGAFAGAFG